MALQSIQRLPVASSHLFYTKKSKDSSSTNSTCRRQGDLLSSLQRPTRHSRHSSRKTFHRHSMHSSHKTFHRHSSSTRTFQSFQTFQSFMTFQPSRHYYTFQYFQYLPVFPAHPGIPPTTAFQHSPVRIQILHTDWFPPETPLSTSRRQYKLTFFKEREMLRYGSEWHYR